MSLTVSDPVCAAEVTALHAALFYSEDTTHPREKRFVVASGVLLREAPSTDAPVYQKLGYGVQVAVVAPGCADGWTLVASPYGAVAHGVGFVRDDLLAAALLPEAEVDARRRGALSPAEAAAWSIIEAVYFPSAEHLAAAELASEAARDAISVALPCDTHFGNCGVLARTNDHGDVAPPLTIARVGVAPWWTLTATGSAQLALFRAAFIATTGECDCCGCDACLSTLDVKLEPVEPDAGLTVAASRRPPPSWLAPLDGAACVDAEAVARASSSWEVPESFGGNGEPAVADAGRCVAGEDGSAWWVQPWDECCSDSPQHRSYRIWPGRGVTVRTERVPLAVRDFDGDGDVETMWGCPYGWVCSSDPGLVHGW